MPVGLFLQQGGGAPVAGGFLEGGPGQQNLPAPVRGLLRKLGLPGLSAHGQKLPAMAQKDAALLQPGRSRLALFRQHLLQPHELRHGDAPLPSASGGQGGLLQTYDQTQAGLLLGRGTHAQRLV